MRHYLQVNNEMMEFLNGDLFPSIYKGESVLFLGAGASVGEKQYLGTDIIDYYQNKIGIDLGTNDLVEFVDIMSARKDFNRDEFDNYIVTLLGKLPVTKIHNRLVAK
jgi:hypothetical protein